MMKPPDTDAFAKARRYGSAQGIPRLMIEPREKPGLEADSPSMGVAECSIFSGEFLGILGMVEACRLLLYTNHYIRRPLGALRPRGRRVGRLCMAEIRK